MRQRVERAVIAMTALAILLMPNRYDCPLVKSLIAMPNMTTLAVLLMPNSYDYPLVKSLTAMPSMTTLFLTA